MITQKGGDEGMGWGWLPYFEMRAVGVTSQ
jgi:hypothetical protein